MSFSRTLKRIAGAVGAALGAPINLSEPLQPGEILSFDGASWVNSTVSGVSNSTNDLTNVSSTTGADGEFIVGSGGSFIGKTSEQAREDLELAPSDDVSFQKASVSEVEMPSTGKVSWDNGLGTPDIEATRFAANHLNLSNGANDNFITSFGPDQRAFVRTRFPGVIDFSSNGSIMTMGGSILSGIASALFERHRNRTSDQFIATQELSSSGSFSTDGAGSLITIQDAALAGDPVAGTYRIIANTSAFGVRYVPHLASVVRDGANVSSAGNAGGYIESTEIGAVIKVLWTGTQWLVVTKIGTWTVN